MHSFSYTSFSTGHQAQCTFDNKQIIATPRNGWVYDSQNGTFAIKTINIPTTNCSSISYAYQELSALDHLNLLEGYTIENNDIFIVMKKEDTPSIFSEHMLSTISFNTWGKLQDPLLSGYDKLCKQTGRQALNDGNPATSAQGIDHLDLTQENMHHDQRSQKIYLIDYSLSYINYGWRSFFGNHSIFSEKDGESYCYTITEKSALFRYGYCTAVLDNHLTVNSFLTLSLSFSLLLLITSEVLPPLLFAIIVLQYPIVAIMGYCRRSICLMPFQLKNTQKPFWVKMNAFMASITLGCLATALSYLSTTTLRYSLQTLLSAITLLYPPVSIVSAAIAALMLILSISLSLYTLQFYLRPIPTLLFNSIQLLLPYNAWLHCINIQFNPRYRLSTYLKKKCFKHHEQPTKAHPSPHTQKAPSGPSWPQDSA